MFLFTIEITQLIADELALVTYTTSAAISSHKLIQWRRLEFCFPIISVVPIRFVPVLSALLLESSEKYGIHHHNFEH